MHRPLIWALPLELVCDAVEAKCNHSDEQALKNHFTHSISSLNNSTSLYQYSALALLLQNLIHISISIIIIWGKLTRSHLLSCSNFSLLVSASPNHLQIQLISLTIFFCLFLFYSFLCWGAESSFSPWISQLSTIGNDNSQLASLSIHVKE